MLWRFAACILLGYLLGSLNGAVLVSKVTMHEDVREKGSGNAGLTNFHRNYGGWVTLLVIAIDMGKVVLSCLLAKLIMPEYPDFSKMLAGFFAQIGHIFPVFFRFRGGKGILCSGTLALMMDWRIFAIAFGLFVLIFVVSRMVSLGSVLGALAYGICFVIFFADHPWIWGMGVAMAAIAIFMHRSNIVRIIKGEERKTFLKKSKNK